MNNPIRMILTTIQAVILLSLVTSCGDVGSGFQVANGVGGTGITMGKITGFGSIHVNGIDFNTDNATFTRDRVDSKAQTDFRTGEIVRVIGTVDIESQTGIATEVIFSDTLEGSVTSIAVNNVIKILGQNVLTDQLTLFHGFNKLSDLALGNIIEVSGLSNTEGNITATSLTLIEESFTGGAFIGVEGKISTIDKVAKSFKINNLTVNYASAFFENINEDSLVDGLFLFVDANQDISDGIMIASNIFIVNDDLSAGDIFEVEGLISEFVSATDFSIEGLPVTTTAQTVYTKGSVSDLKLDSFMRIMGEVNGQGVIVASEITRLDFGVDLSFDIVIEANIEAIDTANSTVTVLGHIIEVDLFTLLTDDTTDDFISLNLSQFLVGDSVFVVATPDVDDTFLASRLSKVEAISSVFLSALMQSSDSQLATLLLSGHVITTDGLTQYQSNESDVTAAVFFSQLVDGSSLVSVSGNLLADGSIQADFLDVISVKDE